MPNGHRTFERITSALVVGLGGLAVVLGATSTAAHSSAEAFTIRSSLDGKKVLPHRIAWIAYPSAAVNFPGVEFLIDGKAVAANRLAPFAFGDDGRDEVTKTVRTGYLVTSWLTPGKHEFTVRAKGQGANRQATATKTVIARVLPAPAPPAELAGIWRRTVPAPVPPDRNTLYNGFTAPAGIYRIAIDSRFAQIKGPAAGARVNQDYAADATTITIAGLVWTGDRRDVGWCDPWGPEASYTWSASDGTLTLAPAGATDGCKQRGAILTGTWTRVK